MKSNSATPPVELSIGDLDGDRLQLHHGHADPAEVPRAVPLHPNLVLAAVARLSDHELGLMTDADLLSMVAMASRPASGEMDRVRAKDHATLLRLGHFVRRGCRAVVNAHTRMRPRSVSAADQPRPH